ncbi:hypothetical protein PISMIDRAFT_101103, partial [Pisolithus microcarpus 441]
KIAVHWIQCCLILHNMIIHFEEKLGVLTVSWAIQEGEELCGDGPAVIMQNQEGTPGQNF